MKTLLEALCEAARRRPRRLRDSNPNQLSWFPEGRPQPVFPDLCRLLFGFSFDA